MEKELNPTMDLATIVEALIFAAQDGIRTSEIVKAINSAISSAQKEEDSVAAEEMAAVGEVTEETVTHAIQALCDQYQEQGHAFMLLERADGWRVFTNPAFAGWVRELFPGKKPSRLSPPALETLAIVAYRQPMTKAGIEAVRGVSVDGVLQTLLDRNVLRIAGRADLPGRPLLYETTDLFLEHFGIKSIDELPNAAELRAVQLPQPELETAEAGDNDGKSEDEKQQDLPIDDVEDSDNAPGDEEEPTEDELKEQDDEDDDDDDNDDDED